MFDFIIAFFLILWVILAIKYLKKHPSGCSGSCANCQKTCASDLKERYYSQNSTKK